MDGPSQPTCSGSWTRTLFRSLITGNDCKSITTWSHKWIITFFDLIRSDLSPLDIIYTYYKVFFSTSISLCPVKRSLFSGVLLIIHFSFGESFKRRLMHCETCLPVVWHSRINGIWQKAATECKSAVYAFELQMENYSWQSESRRK